MKIAVWFSCGAASAVAAKMTVLLYPDADIRILNNPVIEEDADNRRFLNDVSDWIGRPIESVTSRKHPECSAAKIWRDHGFMSGPRGAPCTVELKKWARQEWEKVNTVDWHVLGFTADEKVRHERFVQTERENVIPVLITAGVTKSDCYRLLRNAGLKLPRVYDMGYPNANCIGCVKATSPTYWNHVRKNHPEVFEARAKLSREIGCRLVRVRGERIFLDELSPNITGRPLKNMDFECGIFCEERFG